MPVPTNPRYEHPMSPPLMNTTPARSSLRNPSNYSPTITSGGGQQKLNVVTRVAIEGKAKKGQDGASIKMFLKICLPLDSVTPGSTIPLFPEENVKILTSQVHPLDNNSVPYNFSSTVSPLLHNAARALNLPARSPENFNSAFDITKSNGHVTSSRSSKADNGDHVPPIDIQYTGQILVSGYSISFVLPKVFLSRRRAGGNISDGEEGFSRTPANRRRPSIGERNQAQFMAAIDMWVPFLSKPPRSPYLLSIPSPRCLHNHIKLRIFPPTNTSQSFASLSSMEEDSNAWDLTSDPHVTRSASSRPSRSHSHTHFADDESSDSSNAGMYEGCAIQGTFPSAERIRVRWAKPMRTLNVSGERDGRRRVGVESVKGEMICVVRGKGTSASNPEIEGVLMDVEYKGQCKGVWFPGVATMLGLDVGLEAKGADISWPQGYQSQWEVSGGIGYTGFDNGPSTGPNGSYSRATSFDSNGPQIHVPASDDNEQESIATYQMTRTSSTSSLLRAPLPAQNIAEYSFEGSNATLPPASLSPMGTVSSISSLPASSTPNLPQSPPIRPPGSPVTLHLNMNELQPPVKNLFAFSISGTILVTARATLARLNGPNSSNSTSNDKPGDPEPIVLPRFTVLAADSESTPIIVRNEVEGASVEVFHPTGDIHKDPQARKTVLQKSGSTKCGEDGGRIALKYFDAFGHSINGLSRPASRPRTPSNNMVPRLSSNSARAPFPSRAKRDGPSVITSAEATVTALAPDANMFPTGYAVRVCLKTPATSDSEWLEFGMAYGAKSFRTSSSTSSKSHPKVHIICASLDGVAVKAELNKGIANSSVGGVPFEELSGKEWICWGKVHAGASTGGSMVIDYVVKEQDATADKGKKKMTDSAEIDILLPTFFLSVARLEVKIDPMPGLDISSLRSNFDYHHALPACNRLLLYSLEEFSQPQLSLTVRKSSTHSDSSRIKWYFIFTWTALFIAFCVLYRLLAETNHLHKISGGYPSLLNSWPDIPTVTETTTVYTNMATTRWWFGESEAPSISSSHVVQPTITTALATSSSKTATTTAATTPITNDYGSSYRHAMKETSITNLPQRSILENYGLMPIENLFAFTWSDQHTATFKRALEKVVGSMEFVWNICKRVYHYPLPPP